MEKGKECEKNSKSVIAQIKFIAKYLEKETKRLVDHKLKLEKGITTMKENTKEFASSQECNTKFNCSIGKDVIKSEGKRNNCIAITNESQPYSECFYEVISDRKYGAGKFSIVRFDKRA